MNKLRKQKEVNSYWDNLFYEKCAECVTPLCVICRFLLWNVGCLAKFHSTASSVLESKHQYFIGFFSRQGEKKVGSFLAI